MQPVRLSKVAAGLTWALVGPPRAAGGICMNVPCQVPKVEECVRRPRARQLARAGRSARDCMMDSLRSRRVPRPFSYEELGAFCLFVDKRYLLCRHRRHRRRLLLPSLRQ